MVLTFSDNVDSRGTPTQAAAQKSAEKGRQQAGSLLRNIFRTSGKKGRYPRNAEEAQDENKTQGLVVLVL